jgi:hypothetical protein
MHVIKGCSPIIMGNEGCSPVIKGNNTLLYLAQVSILNTPPQSGRYAIKFRLAQILLNAGPANGLVMISAT